MPDPTRNISNKWADVDAAASAIKNGVQRIQLASGVQASLSKADDAVQVGQQRAATDWDTEEAGIDENGKIVTRPSMSDEAKYSLLNLLSDVAYATPNGAALLADLEDKLFPTRHLSSITADYEQDRPIYDTDDLDAIKAGDDLTVTANYSDGSSVVLGDDDYELSGTLTVGTSTITVSYGGKTTTISVLVTESGVYVGYESIGTPSITGNILTPSSNGSVRTNHVFSPGTSPWKIQVGFTYTGGGSSTYMDVFGSCTSSGTNERVMLLEKSVGFGVFLSSGTSSWNIAQAVMVFSATNNATYLFELEYTGAEYRRRYSTDNGSTWSEYSSVSSTTAIAGGYYVGFGISRNGILDGTIDLSKCKIWIDGDLWWKAVA